VAFFNKRYHPPGTAPGTLVELPAAEHLPLKIRLIDYQSGDVTIKDDIQAADCLQFLQNDSVTWIHVQGRLTSAVLHELGDLFDLHSLALEDVLNSGQRPKIEPFDDQLFMVMSLPIMVNDLVEIEQASFFLSSTFLISFYERDFTPFEPIVKRLQDTHSRLRTRKIDFLLYALLDIVIDQGFPVLENFGQQLEELEEQILTSANRNTLEKIHIVKRELILMRRMLWPQREVINQLLRGDFELVHDDTRIYLRDCYDHTIQVMDLMETYRDMTASMLDIYLSSVSNRMNEIMRVLTVVSTIFIPLTFIVGVYGMNFDRSSALNMPELGWHYGYLLVWAGMITIAVSMVAFFRRRGWL
tara:strand:+ start:1559 stop:2629 length:1071 start_codon:yes stop_codon:yes gene_type:complete